jgi:pyruvate ferredoxin oxidoreductase delta subunit
MAKKSTELDEGFVMKTPKSSMNTKTGTWRAFKPIFDYNKCISCAICWSLCPEPSIYLKDGKYTVDYDYCKGCGICAQECPVKAINMIRESD